MNLRNLLLTLSLCSLSLQSAAYKNPIICADFSDPDVIRVGNRYIMVASDFHFIGMQVLESSDLVHWRYVTQIYSGFDEPGWDSMQHYAGGSWAPAIRYHEGRYYVYFCTPDEGLYMTSAPQPEGPWEPLHLVERVKKWEDPCPFWDEDGQAYLGRSQHGAGPIIVHRMSADGKQLLDEGVIVYKGPVAEGTKFLKRNGWYYLIIPEGGVGTGWQTVLRAKNIYGPYERKITLEQGSTAINGPHQGALVDTPDGSWWFYHFQDTPVLGRIVHLQPARWQDDWPLMGTDFDGNGIGEPVAEWPSPLPASADTLQTSDEFDDYIGLQWQWCHNPSDAYWKVDKGTLKLYPLPADQLKNSRNMLTQKLVGYQGEANTVVTLHGKGCAAGLLCIGKQFRGIGLCDDGIYTEVDGQRTIIKSGKLEKVYLRINQNVTENSFQFFFSIDNKHFYPAGAPFSMRAGYWKGVRLGLFCYGRRGIASFDYFRYHPLNYLTNTGR